MMKKLNWPNRWELQFHVIKADKSKNRALISFIPPDPKLPDPTRLLFSGFNKAIKINFQKRVNKAMTMTMTTMTTRESPQQSIKLCLNNSIR